MIVPGQEKPQKSYIFDSRKIEEGQRIKIASIGTKERALGTL